MKTKEALIIFVRNLEKGKVKTRLAKDLGDDKTLAVYKYLMEYTRDVCLSTDCSAFVYYSDYVHLNDTWEDNCFSKHKQAGYDLGERMQNAFTDVFALGFEKVCIIGSDCYELQTEHIDGAFEKLDDSEVVLGPSADGGYYLLGSKKIVPNIFKDKDWGTASVFDDTVQTLTRLDISYTELETLNDIDTYEDLLETDILVQCKLEL